MMDMPCVMASKIAKEYIAQLRMASYDYPSLRGTFDIDLVVKAMNPLQPI
jgi:hypothetical protein